MLAHRTMYVLVPLFKGRWSKIFLVVVFRWTRAKKQAPSRERYAYRWQGVGTADVTLCDPFSSRRLVPRTSLVVQWLRICLPVQRMWVPSLVQEDPRCRARAQSPCPETREWPPLAAAGESPGVAAKTQCSQKQSRRSSKLPKVRFGVNFMGRRWNLGYMGNWWESKSLTIKVNVDISSI